MITKKAARMDCHDPVYSNDYYDVIIEQTELELGEEYICQQRLSNDYVVYYLDRSAVPELSVGVYKYTTIPKCYTILDQSALEVSGITRVQNQRNLELKGSGILLGFIDTGIQYENSAFRNTDGSSRIAALWDQSVDSDKHPEGFIYGTEYTREQINDALLQENPQEYVPERDEIGHGTRLASIAAGSEDVENDFIGAAPYADIAVVKLKPAKPYLRQFNYIREGAVVYQENDILAAIEYLNRLAQRRGQPLVICVGIGTNQGDHSGDGRISNYLNNIAASYYRAVVIAVGNEANARHHFFGTVQDGNSEKVEINVTRDMEGFTMELWARAPELFAVSVISPTGEVLPRVPVWSGQQQRHRFLLENTAVLVDYQYGGLRNKNQLIHFDFSRPVEGLWTIEVFPYITAEGSFHMYLPMSDFLQEEVYFLRSSPDTTFTVPSGTEFAMAVGGYDAATDGFYINSGRGYTLNGNIKPDFIAPAVGVSAQNQFGRYDVMTGTSAAAAVSAGACALLMEWNINYLNNRGINSIELKNQIINGTRRKINQLYPNREEGWGRLDLYQSLLNMRNV